MIYAPDVSTWRVYSAEQSIPAGRRLKSIDEAIASVKSVTSSSWWNSRYPDPPTVQVRGGGGQRPHPREDAVIASSWAAPDRDRLPRSWTIELHPTMLLELVVLHELAHCISPRYDGDVPALRAGKALFGRHHDHGPMFTASLTALVREFGAPTDKTELDRAYAHFEVPISTEPDLHAALTRGTDVETILEEWATRLPDTTNTATGTAEPAATRWIPTWSWGDELRVYRYRPGRRISQAAVAAAVSAIEPCTRRHIARLENCEVVPDDLRLRRIALAAVAYLGVDPVHARHHLGLVRWDCATDLDELRLVAPDWVEQVEHFNALAEARPATWSAVGDR